MSTRSSWILRYTAPAACGALLGFATLTALTATACKGVKKPPTITLPASDLRAVLQGYAELASSVYSDSADAARQLSVRCRALGATPSQAQLDQARAAWIEARKYYEQSEVFRFYGGPIDRVEFLVNTWPIDEEVIESTSGATGIINDTQHFPQLSSDVLRNANGKGGETAITTGFHALEFLLWGRDTRADGPGQRSPLDFSAATPSGARRAEYLSLAAALLAQNLEEVSAEWASERPGNYRAKFLQLPVTDALMLVTKGMGSLSGPELTGERLTVAYETKDQENEHSCFSDTTHTDVWLDAVGIQNVWLGRYQRPSGSWQQSRSLAELVKRTDAPFAAKLSAQLATTVERAQAIPAPFDQAILGDDAQPGRRAIAATIAALTAQTDSLARLPSALGLSLPLAAVEQ